MGGGGGQESEVWVKKWHFGVGVLGRFSLYFRLSPKQQNRNVGVGEGGGMGGIKRKKWGEEMGGNGGG